MTYFGFAYDTATRLLELTKDCRDDMHEPGEQDFKRVRLVGDHLDNACGEHIAVDAIERRYQEYVLIIERDEEDEVRIDAKFNLATLIALARIGAAQIAKADSAIE